MPPASKLEIQEFALWDKLKSKRAPLSFDLEITARCNLHCRHCYINLPSNDPQARSGELTRQEIDAIADQAVSLGVDMGPPLRR